MPQGIPKLKPLNKKGILMEAKSVGMPFYAL